MRTEEYFSAETDPTPYAEHAERTILGAILLDSSSVLEIASTLEPADFFLDSHRRIFQAMVELCQRDGACDTVTVCQKLADSREIESVGGWSYITDLTQGLPTHPVLDSYINTVKIKAQCRALLTVSEGLRGRAYDAQDGLGGALWAISELSHIATASEKRKEVVSAEEMAEDAEYRLCDHPESDEPLSTGLRCLDDFTSGGIRWGELWIVGAAPSRGKTALARQIVKHNIAQGIPCYVHSGEMSKESWWDVTACLLEDMPAWKIREPRLLNVTDRERLRTSIRSMAQMPFYLSDTGGIQLDKLIWNATRQYQEHGIKLMAVDYAQIIKAQGRDPREQVTNVAQRLRVFAKDNGVAVLLLSQSPRPEGRNLNRLPTMFDLKESGALEEAAHTVILPFRPVDPESGQWTGEDLLVVGKQRWGSIGSIPARFNGEYLRFEGR